MSNYSFPADPDGNVLAPRKEAWPVPKEIAGVKLPDSKLAADTMNFVREVSAPIVFNHALRTYVIGELMARGRGQTMDSELFFLGAICHDLGQAERFIGDQRFEIEGADAAVEWLVAQGHDDADRNEVVWDAIAFHTSDVLPLRKRPEIALVGEAAVADICGVDTTTVPQTVVNEVMKTIPREKMKTDYIRVLTEMARRRPPATSFGNHMGYIGSQFIPGFEPPFLWDIIEAAPYDE